MASTRRRWITPSFIVQFKPTAKDRDQDEAPAIGFTVTKKVGNAVIRNKMRRRMKEVARLVLNERGATGAEYVMIGREGGIDASFDKMVKDMKWALEKLSSNTDLKMNNRSEQSKGQKKRKNRSKEQ